MRFAELPREVAEPAESNGVDLSFKIVELLRGGEVRRSLAGDAVIGDGGSKEVGEDVMQLLRGHERSICNRDVARGSLVKQSDLPALGIFRSGIEGVLGYISKAEDAEKVYREGMGSGAHAIECAGMVW